MLRKVPARSLPQPNPGHQPQVQQTSLPVGCALIHLAHAESPSLRTRSGQSITRAFRWLVLGLMLFQAGDANAQENSNRVTEQMLSSKQQALIPIAAFAAIGEIPQLNTALRRGLDAGLTVSQTKEVLVQMYAYAGFPRSLNALGELMKVLAERKQQGIADVAGEEPAPGPTGAELLAAGTANQTELSGAPVKGPLFDFAPAIDFYLKAHLFGDIFSRANLDWRSRELATVSALAAMTGTEGQLQAHIRISMNVGLSEPQLRQVAVVLQKEINQDAGQRANEALDRHLATVKKP